MHARFAKLAGSLRPSFERLMAMEPVTYLSLPKAIPKSGVYLFSEGERHLYVGRSRKIRGRLGRHCRPGATHRMAAFAFRLARESTGELTATYKPTGSRADLISNPSFLEAFSAAKDRIRGMDIRYVEEPDALRQTLLEVYAAVVLETPYNVFDTH